MSKPELGTKRHCGNCGSKFYDLGKEPIICPKCDTVQLAAVTSRSRFGPAGARAAADGAVPETQKAKVVSLEEAEAGVEGGEKVLDGEAVEGADEEIEDGQLDDGALIEEQDPGDEDVADIIGDLENKEEL